MAAHRRRNWAEKRYSEWLSGYQVVISQVLRTYGDDTMLHPLRTIHTMPEA